MRKLSIVIGAGMFAMLALVPSQASIKKTATILLPSLVVGLGGGAIGEVKCTDINDPNCEKGTLSRTTRCVYGTAGPDSQTDDTGITGYVIPIDGQTTFELKSEPPGTADFDVSFLLAMAVCESNAPSYPTGTKSSFNHFGNNGESGAIPEDTAFAVISLFGSASQSFTFTAS